MVAAQCARPLSTGGQWQDLWQNIAKGVSPEMKGATCLGDVLTAHGYHTVLMTGTAMDFAGLGTFHAAHGFAERLGFEPSDLQPSPRGLDAGALWAARRRCCVLHRCIRHS